MVPGPCYFSPPQTDTAQATSPCNENSALVEMNKSSVSHLLMRKSKTSFEAKLWRWVKCQAGSTQEDLEVFKLGQIDYLQDKMK